MKKLSMLSLVVGGVLLGGCSDDDKDFVLNTERLSGVDWYYNGYKGDQFSYASPDVLEVMRFENNKQIIGIEFSGRRDSVAGSWEEIGVNTLRMDWNFKTAETWTVMDCSGKALKVNNGWGDREYRNDLSYLENLTGDAFWVNEFDSDVLKTRLGVRLEGNKSIREGYAYALLSDETSGRIKLQRLGSSTWGENTQQNVGYDKKAKRVRFSCRIGGNYVKFDEYLSADNFPVVNKNEIGMTMAKTENIWIIAWKDIQVDDKEICYRLEVYDEKEEGNPYYVSQLIAYPKNGFELSRNSAGVINRLNDLNPDKKYKLRLTVAMLEDGIAFNNTYAPNNLQAVIYVTDDIWL